MVGSLGWLEVILESKSRGQAWAQPGMLQKKINETFKSIKKFFVSDNIISITLYLLKLICNVIFKIN